MKLCLINHEYRYELEKLIRLFYPFEKIEFFNNEQTDELSAISELDLKKSIAEARLYVFDKVYEKSAFIDKSAEDFKKEYELKLATVLYECLIDATKYIPDWGLLTGVRPAKLFSRFRKNMGESAAEEYFRKVFKVSDAKISLCKETIVEEEKITSLSKWNSFSLYISIPFCPSRCSYCSFVSHSVDKAKRLIPQYVKKLCEELRMTAQIAKENNLRLETIYIGGGTPTAISAQEIDKIMSTVSSNFDLTNLREYTVESGRPDTVTEEKLWVIKQNGATRISINPQSMCDRALEAIGRKHTAKQTIEAYELARKIGFNNINMDLIAGLPMDDLETFKNTVNTVIGLKPESVTVHTLSMKRSSTLTKKGEFELMQFGETASLMVNYARERLSKEGILPYYMYRQSKTVGNLENVGYAKKGYECLYNVYIMDETHTILACGASAVTKLREPNGDYIERIFNYKYPYEYINRFDELTDRKQGITPFYTHSLEKKNQI